METFLQYTIFGLVTGGVYGIAASGLVVTYTTSGIFNFAHGAVAMLAAFVYWQVRFDWGWPAPLALLLVLGVLAPLLGALLYGVVMRGLRGTAEVTRIVVPVSVMLGFLALSTWVWDPTPRQPRLFLMFFGADNTVSIAGVNVTYHELLSVVLAVVIALGLRFLFFRTRSGVAMRAVVDDPDLLELNAGRPERLAMLSWALGAFLAALAGVLITPIQGTAMRATDLTLLVIDAFAAAMFGRLRSLPRTFLGALVLGLAGSYVIGYFPADDWTWTGNFRVSLPMIALFVVLLFLPQDRLRGATILRTRERFRLPSVRSAVVAGLALVGVMFLVREILAPTALNYMAFSMTAAVIALSLVLLTGYAGEINLAVLSFGAIGAIVGHHYGISGSGSDARSTLGGYVLAAVVWAVIRALVALPSLRLPGLYLALSAMAFGGILFGVAFVALQNTFDKLGVDYPDAEGLFDFLARFTTVMPALMGVSMGRNPTGAVEQVVREFGALRRVKPILVAGCAAMAVAYLLTRNDSISNWWFVVIVGVVVAAMPLAAKRLAPARGLGPAPAPAGPASADGGDEMPLELVGVSRPFSPAD